MRYARNQRGMTLLEMVIAMALMAIVVAVFYQLVAVAVRGWAGLEGQMEVQQIPRVTIQRVLSEVMQSRDFMIGTGGSALGLVKMTILTADAAAGATSLVVEDASMLVVGRPTVLVNANRLEQVTVTAIAGTTLTVGPLATPHRRGEVVRRAQSTLTAAASAGATTLSVAAGGVFQVGDPIAVEDEVPLTVTAIAGNTLTIAPALALSHAVSQVVQPLSVLFRLTGAQLVRCTAGCNIPANEIVVADSAAAPPGRQLFASVRSTLVAAAPIGATQVCVQSVAGFAANDRIQIDREAYPGREVMMSDRRRITAVNSVTNCLTFDRGITRPGAAGAHVRVPALEMNMLATQFNDALQQTQEVAVSSRAAMRN
ncbi:MAG TPA: prepilin-type N-terminal cleavage/methylation domain-containing protein [bacterium]|nr:prepilin-type N-terminal cleavage/methylation domain-containing protein [bacterium]